jgi:nitroimidazol reductase NimA-like FMN-containing flavoprotein (pyridoxamine 5'-phosphate oxidase superfamily)
VPLGSTDADAKPHLFFRINVEQITGRRASG